MPRSERCRIRGNCLQGIALLSLAQAPVADGAPAADRAARRAGASRRTGLSPSGERWRGWASGRNPSARLSGRGQGMGEGSRRSSDKAQLEDDRPGPASALPGGWAARAGRGSQPRAHRGRRIGFGGANSGACFRRHPPAPSAFAPDPAVLGEGNHRAQLRTRIAAAKASACDEPIARSRRFGP
jgi:hypothetical protein